MNEGFEGWEIRRLGQVAPQDFFDLVSRNLAHIGSTFPKTSARCASLLSTGEFFEEKRANEQAGTGFYFYLYAASGRLIGYVCIKNVNREILKCELAYFIDRDLQGKGIMSLAVGRVLEHCFSGLGMNKVFICTSKENAASQRIAAKHRFANEGLLRQEFRSGGGKLEDILYFGLLKEDYER